jgi:hypothetical protein
MIIRLSMVAVFAGLVLTSYPASAQVPGASEACKTRCEQQACQATRLSKGECMLRCTSRCKDASSKKKKS